MSISVPLECAETSVNRSDSELRERSSYSTSSSSKSSSESEIFPFVLDILQLLSSISANFLLFNDT